jgi:dTMP kinase
VTRGLLIVFEGPEGVGKTTQVTRLADRLNSAGVRAERYREPGGTPLGTEIRELLLNPSNREITPGAEALLFMAARAQLMAHVESRLVEGAVVLLDRFFLSTYAYQIVGRGLDERLVRDANQLAVRGMTPDVTLLLACDLDVAQSRMRARGDLDRIEQAGAAFHERVTTAFLAASDPAWQAAHAEVGPVVRVDADGSVDEVGARIEAVLKTRWPETFSLLRESL